MTRDFTIVVYKDLLQSLQASGYRIQSYIEYIQDPVQKAVILRHDVDKNPNNALKLALLENKIGVHATYYFRIIPVSYSEIIINKIAELGHEIGYHYEDLSLAKGNIILAKMLFEKHLSTLRELYPVKTICMHGSPLLKWDNRLLWYKYNYWDYGIIGEPYLNLDFTKVLYLTDSGRCWNGENTIVRDKVPTRFNYNLKSTFDLIKAFKQNIMPENVMLTVHSQRWNNDLLSWSYELLAQNIKNIIKKYFFVKAQNEF